MTDAEIPADWAWISKDPAAGIGYGVLATSVGAADFSAFVGRFAVGSPSSTAAADSPDAAPWVTFGPAVMGQNEVVVSVTIRDPWRESDYAGRPIWPQRVLASRFADLAAADASFQTIWAAARDAVVPAADGAPLGLRVQRQSLIELCHTITAYGFEQLAAVTAAVLEGPVAIAGAGGLHREQRLAILDAVASLLPYGFRADLSASSSADNTVRHGVRLVFADFAGEDQRLMWLRQAPAQPETKGARRYLDMLHEKTHRADPGRMRSLLEYLWAAKEPYFFDAPGRALAVVDEYDFYGSFRRSLADGRVTREQVLRFFTDPDEAHRHWRSPDIDEQLRMELISSVLADRDEQVASAIFTRWKATGSDVVVLVNSQLEQGGVELAAWSLQVAGRSGGEEAEDRLLGELLVPDQHTITEGLDQRLATLVQVLTRRAVPRPGEFRHTCGYLRFGDDARAWQAALVRTLLSRELASGQRAGRAVAWVRWLCDTPFSAERKRPDWIAALGFFLRGAGSGGSAESVRALIEHGTPWAVVLLQLSKQTGSFADLLEATDQQLAGLAARTVRSAEPAGTTTALRDELSVSLRRHNVHPGTGAAIDAARVLLGAEPLNFADQGRQQALDSYGDGLSSVFALPMVRDSRNQLEQGFLRHAVPGRPAGQLSPAVVWLLNTWSADPERMPGLVSYIATLDAGARPYSDRLDRSYWAALARYPGLAGYAASEELISVAKEAIHQPEDAFRRTVSERGVSSTRLARACYEARCAGLPVDGMISALRGAGANRIPNRRLDDTLREFQSLLFLAPPRAPGSRDGQRDAQSSSEADLFECYRLIAGGALGEPFAAQFRSYLAARLDDEIHTRRRVRETVLPGAHARGAPTVPPASGHAAAGQPARHAAMGPGPVPNTRQLRGWRPSRRLKLMWKRGQ